ncbi:hypothetical protein, partial [Thermococcus sp. GR7]
MSHDVKRWLHIRKSGNTEFWSFQHEALRENFFRVLEEEVETVREKLLDFCSENWKENEYCLKHYPEHLYDAGRYDELFELVRNEEFLNTQRELAGGTTLVLGTVELAINAAANVENLARLFEFAFLYNRIYNETGKMSLFDRYRIYGLEATINFINKNQNHAKKIQTILLLISFLVLNKRDKDAKQILQNKIDLFLECDQKLKFILKYWELI